MMDSSIEKPWKNDVVDTLTRNTYFAVLLQNVTVPDGTQRTYYTIKFPRPSVGIVVRRGTEYLLVRQYRFIVDEYVWAIPSGGVAENETFEEAAVRELREETGCRARELKPLLDCYASYGCSDQRFIIFLAEDVESDSGDWDSNEVISHRWFTRDQLIQLINENGIVDNLSLSPLLLVLLRDGIGIPYRRPPLDRVAASST